jgi:hypothetical protein
MMTDPARASARNDGRPPRRRAPTTILLAFVFGRSTRQRMEGLAASVPLAVAGFGAFVVAAFDGWGVLQTAAPTVGCCTQRYSYLVR